MRRIRVTIQGSRAILLNNPAKMSGQTNGNPQSSAGKKGEKKKASEAIPGKRNIPEPEQEAAASCYWVDDHSALGFPGQNMYRGIVSVAGSYRAGKLTMTSYIAGGIEIEPEMIPFYTNDQNGNPVPIATYQIDTRRAVVQRQGVMRSRARIPAGWLLTFDVIVSEEDLPQKSIDMIRPMVAELGRRVGVGDFRPQKMGPFGKFVIIGWEEIEDEALAA